MIRFFLYSCLLITLLSCGQNKPEQSPAVAPFNEGVAFSLDADAHKKQGNEEQAKALYILAIQKFQETVRLDPSHKMVAGALGHSYYMTKDYRNGRSWYEKSISLGDSLPISHQEYGLCILNLGDLEGGKKALSKALELSRGPELKNKTVLDLYDVGTLAFHYGSIFEQQGEAEKGINYKKFGVSSLLMAHELDSSDLDVIGKIAEFAEAMGEQKIADRYYAKLEPREP